MNSDGTKKGYNLKLTKLISENVSVPVIASGGAGSPKDMVEVVLKAGASAVLAFYFSLRYSFNIFCKRRNVKKWNKSKRL